MKRRLFISVAAGLATYLILNVVFGALGVRSYHELTRYHARLERNIAEMSRLQDRLERRARKLRSDTDTVRLEARKLGYYADTEQPIRIRGYDPREGAIPAGTLLEKPDPRENRQPLFRAIALSSGLVVFLLLLL